MTHRIAVLDSKSRLIGDKTVARLRKGDIEIGDLPTDGSYFHRDGAFVPVGFGNGKVRQPKVDRDRALYEALRALIDGRPIPQECRDWCDWYERHGKR